MKTAAPVNFAAAVPVFDAGLISLQVGDDGNAAKLLPQATQMIPQEPAAWANLGLFRLRQGDFNAARDALTKAQNLAPKNGQIEALLGLLEGKQGHFAEAVSHLKQSVALVPDNLRVRYALIEALRQQAGTGENAEAQAQLDELQKAAPENPFVLFEAAIQAAKDNDAGKVRAALDRMAAQSNRWPADAQIAFKAAQATAAGTNSGALVGPLTGLRHLLEAWPNYQREKLRVQPPPGAVGEPLETFLALPPPSPTPAPPDLKLTYAAQPIQDGESEFLKMQKRLAAINATPVRSPAYCVADFNNDSRPDVCLADKGGLRLFEQGKSGLADVTKRAKLPAEIIGAAYNGAWAEDLDGDGDLDLILGTASGIPCTLRNNNDGTWTPIAPFGTEKIGIRDFAWGDLDGDGVADAVIVDGQGRLIVFENRRSGHFAKWNLPPGFENVAAVSVADVERKGTLALTVLRQDGSLVRLRRQGEQWESAEIAKVSASVLGGGEVRLFWADFDNNGGPDLVAAGGKAAQIFLNDAQGALQPLSTLIDGRISTLEDTSPYGRIALLGEATDGKPTRWTAKSEKNYGWQRIQLKAAAVGDNRNNSFGIGGEIELRAGLLYAKIPVTGPIIHFGLGDHAKADYIRIVWPNGYVQGEFTLAPNQMVNAPERLKGSCPWLFADNGQGMKFVTDLIWRSPLGLRLNAQATAGVVQTRDWVKIRGDQLRPRAGMYHLNVTAELWETHFFDLLELRTLDHPAGTEARIDERFAIPPPPLQAELMTPPQPIYWATDDRGRDVTAIVRAQDGSYLDTFGRGAYQGVTRDHYVELDFGLNLPKGGKMWLVAYGWVHPTDSSINVAISQGNHAPPRDLSLEIPDGKGGWKAVRPHLGFPEGKNKTVLIDVTGLFRPGEPARARLRTNLEIYWDFIGTASGLPPDPMRIATVPLRSAVLRYRGFSVTHQPNSSSPEVPDYVVAGTAPRWLDLSGYYTRFGDVRELLAIVDDRYVIMNAGDEMRLEFSALPPPPVGWVRDYILVGDGWVKDGDFNTGFSKTVLPLPLHDRPNYDAPPTRLEDDQAYRRHPKDWQTYQTRYVAPDALRNALSGR